MRTRQDDQDGDLVRAAGAVLWRERGDGEVEFALVHRSRYDDWSFPKGKLKTAEHVLRAAAREVEEETGYRVVIGRRLSPAYYTKDGRPKRVDYWAATPRTEGPFVPNDEVDRMEWLPATAAARRLSYPHDLELLQEACSAPLRTVPYILLRHGSSGDKRLWDDDDSLRPLDPRGRADATALARVLDGLPPLRPVSSATARCVETVLPYALRTQTEVVTDRAFTVGTAESAAVADRMSALISTGEPVLICTHGEIVNGLITELCARMGLKAPEEPSLRKGSFWLIHVAGKSIVSLERHTAH